MATSGGGEGPKEPPPIRSTSLGKGGVGGGGGQQGAVRRNLEGGSHSLSVPKENHSGGVRRRTEVKA